MVHCNGDRGDGESKVQSHFEDAAAGQEEEEEEGGSGPPSARLWAITLFHFPERATLSKRASLLPPSPSFASNKRKDDE